MIIDENVYLEHFGVKGMQWGVYKSKFSRENRAQKSDARAAGYQKQIDELKANPKFLFNNKRIKNLSEFRDKELADAKAKREGKLTQGQKKALIGVGVAAAIIGSYGAYQTAEVGEFNRLASKGKMFVTGKDIWKKDPRLATKGMDAATIKSVVVDQINPSYGAPGTKMNCRRATFAYEMRRRGNDVKATRSMAATGQNAVGLLKATTTKREINLPTRIPGIQRRLVAEATDIATGKTRDVSLTNLLTNTPMGKKTINLGFAGHSPETSVFRALSGQPDGARGELGVMFKMGGGHSMAWEIIKGKAVIFDAQDGSVYSNAAEFAKVANSVGVAQFSRLDNIPLNTDYLMRWVKNA